MKRKFYAIPLLLASFAMSVACSNTNSNVIVEEKNEKITVLSADNGSLKLSKNEGKIGELISITPLPKPNYEVDFIKHNDVILNENKDKTYTFTIVEGENVISSKFKKIKEEPTPNPDPTPDPDKPTPEPDKPTPEPNPNKPEVDENGDLPAINNIRVLTNEPKNLYAWNKTNDQVTEYLGKWPGTQMNKLDNTWYYIDLPEGLTSSSVIFNDKQQQTADLSVEGIGYHWFKDNQWSHSNKYGGEFGNSNPDTPSPDAPYDPVIAESYKDFAIWDEMKANPNQYKIVNKYKGNRHDFRDETIYFALTTRFYDGDSSNNVVCWDGKRDSSDPEWRGDFKGLINRLDYIKALGFTSVWITPIVENASGFDYHGYHALDFSKVDPRYESTDCGFQDLINACHEKDMKIILDVVFNHTGNFGEINLLPLMEKKFEKIADLSTVDCMKITKDSPLPKNYESLPGGQQYYERICALKNERKDGSDPRYIYHHYGNFSYESFGEQMAQIAGDCVDLNTENPLVAEYLVRCYGEFIRMGVDYFRIDTFKHISRLTWNNYYLPALYEYAKLCGNNEFYCFGEVCTRVREVWNHNIPALSAPFYTWKESKEYPWGDAVTNIKSIEQAYEDNKQVSNEPTSTNAKLNGVKYHTPNHSAHSGASVIDFPMHWNFYYAKNAFNIAVSNDQYYNDATYNVVYVDSHDYSPDDCQYNRYDRGTNAWAENMSLMFTFRGVPCIYYGSEIEFQKGKRIDDGPRLALKDSGRAYFGDHLEGSINTTDFSEFSATGEINNTLNSKLSRHLQDLNKIRAAVPALRLGQYTTNNCSGSMSYIRRYTSGNIDSLALVTVSGNATFNNVPNGTYVDVVTGKVANVTNGKLSASCSGEGNMRCYVLQNSSTGVINKIASRSPFLK